MNGDGLNGQAAMRHVSWGILVGCVILVLLLFPALGRGGLAAGDKVIFLGDSITAGGVLPNGYVSLFREGLFDAGLKASVEGAGVPGDTVLDLVARFERDVLKKNPSIVVIMVGLNDAYGAHLKKSGKELPLSKQVTPEIYRNTLQYMVREIAKTGARVVIGTPSVVGERVSGGNPVDQWVEEFAEGARMVARAEGLPLVEVRKGFKAYLKQYNHKDLEQGVLTYDSVHLNDAGNRLLADIFLEAFGLKSKNPGPGQQH